MRIPLAAALFASVFIGACSESPMSPAQPSINVPVRIKSEPRAGLRKLRDPQPRVRRRSTQPRNTSEWR